MTLGLRTTIYNIPDLARGKAWYQEAFGIAPYFDEPFYVGFNIGGYELGLDPNPASGEAGAGGTVAYWGVPEIDAAVTHFESVGGMVVTPSQDVGGGIRVATVSDPFGNHVGLIENPNFTLGEGGAAASALSSISAAPDKARFVDAYAREHATTMKVLRAFPPNEAAFRPHERSNTALQLAWTFVIEERMMLIALKNESVLGSGFPPPPDSWEGAVDAFEAQHGELAERLRDAGEAELGGTVKFFTGPNQTGDIPTLDFL